MWISSSQARSGFICLKNTALKCLNTSVVLIPVAERSKVYGRSVAGIAGSNPLCLYAVVWDKECLKYFM
jgi:hypothetical protein